MSDHSWKTSELSQLLSKVIDYRGQSVPKSSDGIPLITARNVRDGFMDFSHKEYVAEAAYSAWATRGAPEVGDILFTTEAPLGNVAPYPEGTFALGQRLVALRTNEIVDDAYLFQYLRSERGKHQVEIRASGSTAKGIKSSELKKIDISYPICNAEQKKIATILSTWDDAIATTEKLLANSEKQKKAMMARLLTPTRSPTGSSNAWANYRLGEIFTTFTGISGKNKDDFNTGTAKYISYMNVFTNPLTNYDQLPIVNIGKDERQNRIRHGDILLTTSSETPVEVGMSSVVISPPGDIYLNSFCFGLRPIDLNLLDPKFAGFLFRSAEVRKKIASLAQGATRYNLSKTNLLKLTLDLPDLHEQKKVAMILGVFEDVVDQLKDELGFLKQQKSALMQQLLTGKRRVKTEEQSA